MTEPVTAEERRRMQIISGGMLAGLALMLGVSVFVRQASHPVGIPALGWIASAMAVVSPIVAAVVSRTAGGAAPSPAVARHIVAYGILEGAALFCGTAIIVGPSYLPLVAAAVPIGAMILRFPRAS